ncbi:hypothetical protein [Synechococcus phage S-N03]|uniref:Uncharacterized protein n=1 Tax=Synechococcus phage S-N03 TaxID=2718943 RepID=A0A6G8R663_9CAUD|nr:hypothetical protein PQC09_gp204 [Synechococcus phage S-N03]QIN96863.1 hypothetical protein [Synechococcus phage S-N03]
MKTYQELMEVMSMKDMKTITGGTDAQRKVAQDRQKKRDAKNKGFDPKKPVLADKKKEEDEAPAGLDDLLKDIRSEPKAEKKPEPKPSSSAIVKAEPKAVEKRKPDLRKSQIGKWSEGIKKSPGKLAKRPESKPAVQDVQKVKVKVDEPKKRDDMEGQAGQHPGTTRPEEEKGKGLVDHMKKKKKKGPGVLGKAKSLAGKALRKAKGVDLGRTGISTSGNLEGLTGTQRYE